MQRGCKAEGRCCQLHAAARRVMTSCDFTNKHHPSSCPSRAESPPNKRAGEHRAYNSLPPANVFAHPNNKSHIAALLTRLERASATPVPQDARNRADLEGPRIIYSHITAGYITKMCAWWGDVGPASANIAADITYAELACLSFLHAV